MSFIRLASTLIAAATMCLGLVARPQVASAADLPVKAKPVPIVGASVPLDVHGSVDFTIATNRVTGAGLLLYPYSNPRGILEQINGSLALDVYKDPTGFINLVTIYGGVWNEFWTDPVPGSRVWQEMDMYGGASVVFAKYWKFDAQHVQFHFPSSIPTAYNYVFTLSYDDSGWGLPFTINPYISVFWNAADAGSLVVYGKAGNTYRVTAGIVPTFGLQKSYNIPVTLFFPTAIVFGPSEFWNTGNLYVCGSTGTGYCEPSNLGMFTTGLDVKLALDQWVPKRLGSWYAKAGVHYYYLINDALLAAQVVTGAAASPADEHRDVWVGSVSLGFGF